MKQKIIKNNLTIKTVVLAILSLLVNISFSFAESKIIVEGSSSIIIESQSNTTRILMTNIETITGGRYIDKNNSSNSKGSLTTSIESVPKSFVIENAYPNPFNPTTNIKYGLEKSSEVDISIFDLTGRLMNNYKINAQSPGWHEFTWNGTDANEQRVCAGVYFVTMRAGGSIQKQKVTLLK